MPLHFSHTLDMDPNVTSWVHNKFAHFMEVFFGGLWTLVVSSHWSCHSQSMLNMTLTKIMVFKVSKICKPFVITHGVHASMWSQYGIDSQNIYQCQWSFGQDFFTLCWLSIFIYSSPTYESAYLFCCQTCKLNVIVIHSSVLCKYCWSDDWTSHLEISNKYKSI